MSPTRPLDKVRVKRRLQRAFPGKGNTFYRGAADVLVELDPTLLEGEGPAASQPGIIDAVATPRTIRDAIAAINGEIHSGKLWQYVARYVLQSSPDDFHDFIVDWLGRPPQSRKREVIRQIRDANVQKALSGHRGLNDLLVLFAVLLGGVDRPDDPEMPVFLHAIGGRLRTLALGPPTWATVTVFPFDEPIRRLAKALADDAAALSTLRWCRGRCLEPHDCKRGNGGPLFLDRNRRTGTHPTIVCCNACRHHWRTALKRHRGGGTPHLGAASE